MGHVAHMVKMRGAYKVFIRELKEKRLLGKPRHRW
jgi:hypothetical protein